MTQYPGPGGEQPPSQPPGYPTPYGQGTSPYGQAPTPYGPPGQPPPRKGWSTGLIVAVTLGGLLLACGLVVAVVFALVPFSATPGDPAERDDRGRIVRAQTVDKDHLRTGDCVNDAALRDLAPGKDLDTLGAEVDAVPCRQAHDFEVFEASPLPKDGDYDGAAAIQRAANRQCISVLRRDWSADRKLLRDKAIAYYMPPQLAPEQGNVVCMLQLMSGEQMRGTIR